MDARRLLILTASFLMAAGCAQLRPIGSLHETAGLGAGATTACALVAAARAGASIPVAAQAQLPAAQRPTVTMAPIPNPPARGGPRERHEGPGGGAASGRAAITEANTAARQTSRRRAFLGGAQVFVYDPGRVYEVWTAPLRVTTLTLSPGESVISKAAGDTVRWQIGETASGEGASRRPQVMIKPLRTGLETNLVLTTNRRIYLVELRSGPPDGFNAQVAWDLDSVMDPPAPEPTATPVVAPALAAPEGPLDAGYRITPKGHRPSWTPTAVMTDGAHTFITFPASLGGGEAPALFALGAGGEPQLVNYRQRGDLWVVDRVLQSAELRLGDRHPEVVRIERTGDPS